MNKRNVILGIVVVICLDLAFILLTMSDASSDQIARAIDYPVVAPEQIFRRPEISSPSEVVVATEESADEKNVSASAKKYSNGLFRDSSRTAGSEVRMRQDQERVNDDPPVKFEDTVIWYERVNYSVREQAEPIDISADCPIRRAPLKFESEPAQKKRSLITKALPVIKKPYDLLKTFGSKLY